MRNACASQMTTVCIDTMTRKPHAVSGIATDCSGTKAERVTKLHSNVYKAKEALISQTCPGTRWLDDAISIQGEKRVASQVTVVTLVTGIDISSTGSRNFTGDLTLGTLSHSLLP